MHFATLGYLRISADLKTWQASLYKLGPSSHCWTNPTSHPGDRLDASYIQLIFVLTLNIYWTIAFRIYRNSLNIGKHSKSKIGWGLDVKKDDIQDNDQLLLDKALYAMQGRHGINDHTKMHQVTFLAELSSHHNNSLNIFPEPWAEGIEGAEHHQ